MSETRIHYKCTFFVKIKENIPVETLIDMISEWVLPKVQTNDQVEIKHLRSTSVHTFHNGSIETFLSQKDLGAMDVWALKLVHSDRLMPIRNWRVDVIVKSIGANNYRIDFFVYHFLSQGYVGAEPGAPIATTPRIVIEVLGRTDSWVPYYGNDPLTSTPTSVSEGGFPVFVEKFLMSKERIVPIIYFSLRRGSENEIVAVAAQIAILLAGTCMVFVAADSTIDNLLEKELGQNYRCDRGMVRIYSPGIQTSNPEDYKRHRFFNWHYISNVGYDKMINTLVSSIVRRNAFRADVEQLNFDDVMRRLDHDRLVAATNENRQWTELYENDNKALTEDIAKYKRDIEALNEFNEVCEQQLAERNYEYKLLKERTDHLQKLLKERTTDTAIVGMLSRLPETVHEVIEVIGKIWESRLMFTPEALDSARSSAYKDFAKAWACLWSMGEVLHPLFFNGSRSAKEIENEYVSKTGFDYSVSDSSQTKASSKLVKMRNIEFNGVEYDMMPHVKLGNSPSNSLRIHFAIDRESQRLIVGHCGDHIETAGTKRKGIK